VELAQAIVECSRATNPMSDEEGEDLVAQCQKTMKAALCPLEPAFSTRRYWRRPCRLATTPEERAVCGT
jgi:hypothetical protein